MSKTISAAEAQSHFDDLVRDLATGGETVFVEQSGKKQVVVLSVDEFERMGGETNALGDWLQLVDRTRENIARERNGRPMPDVSEVVREMREERDAQIDDAVRGC